jgi:hypothetical protein
VTKTAKPVGVVGELAELRNAGWLYNFSLGEFVKADPSRIMFVHPDEATVETMLSVAVGETCSSCLKASTMTGERCLRCYGENRTRHLALVQIDVRNNR